VVDRNRVLLVGFDPRWVPGVDAAMVEMAIAMGETRLREHGFVTTYCLVAPDDSAETSIAAALTDDEYDCVVVGGGIRKAEEHVELFERIVNLSRVHAPRAAIACNTTGENSVEAVLRWLPDRAGG
jgi:hypothetical protein